MFAGSSFIFPNQPRGFLNPTVVYHYAVSDLIIQFVPSPISGKA